MQYLEVPFREKDQAKALGARWDAVRKKWFVPSELAEDLSPFQRWLPAQADLLEMEADKPSENKPLSLSQLLHQVEAALQQRFPTSVWVHAEIAELSERRHLYLHLVETDTNSQELARVRATLWQSQIESLVGKFVAATGSSLAPGQKVLLKVQVRFHPRYGLSLNIEDIDPSYTLGDIQAQLAKLREQLKAMGLYGRNRQLPLPQEFTRVAVIAPPKAAGLGDFQRDAKRLQQFDLCQFAYFHASFQGERVEDEFMAAFDAIEAQHVNEPFDALVIIRGGGAQLDLHQLNRLSIAQRIAQCPLPVFTGIGHERDNTLLDEVAAQRFDTPSKVIAHIREVIVDNARQAQQNWLAIQKQARQQLHRSTLQLNQLNQTIHHNARLSLHHAWQKVNQYRQRLQWSAHQILTKQKQALMSTGQQIRYLATAPINLQRQFLHQLHRRVLEHAWQAPVNARQQIENWMRHILLLGPQKQLQRGFALVRDEQGRVVRRGADLKVGQPIQIQFDDGVRKAKVEA
ncbi:Exodeoxyribonuclease VII large subunit [Sulfurivirga caldicuralii]|uniref:Exodeoxyribonuclease 7 large subunit n=1 Tax=Sulfurivirga caldicuralii TaxID=364032 RepID=A0A1N6FAJ1_9GAMM|nr:exodeoxyribonuclease VII large subunit [Sulfurivirga caldicuralii]SIN92206.1 Exodeoxyribonuclease VII large subunit [Sulfurivirga caldicuralii]